MKRIYTLGTSLRSEEEFMEILASYSVELVVDVRSSPISKLPTYRREYLEKLLRVDGIGYCFMGAELGGFRKGGYEAYSLTEGFKDGVTRLEMTVGEATAVVLCAERFPWKCHRRWIASELGRRGWKVVHIIDKGKVWAPA